MSMRERRGTIALEDAAIIEHRACAADQFILRLHAPVTARRARPGQFVHLQCADDFPLRRPLSIMRADPAGWIEVLYKPVGAGLSALTKRKVQETLSVLGPIGNGFDWSDNPRRILALGGGVGIPPMVFLAEDLVGRTDPQDTLLLMGSELPFPFEMGNAKVAADWLADDIDATLPALDDMGIPCRLASQAGFAGCFRGLVTDLAQRYLETLGTDQLGQTELFACGPTPMLEACARLAARFHLPCQVSLEEFMACAVGGCAGCTVQVQGKDGPAMKRVCVDGPVFEAASVFPE